MSVAVNTSPAGAIGNQGSWKRRASDDEDNRGADVKKARYSWYVTLESESPVPTDEDEESIYTEQGHETEYARDTSDTSTHTYYSSSNSESDVAFQVQYELAPSSDNDEQFHSISGSSSSGPEENIIAVEIVNHFSNCDGHADDSDDSRSSMDSEVKKSFFRTCVQCKGQNHNPLFQFCDKCYQLRKSYYPRERPRRKPRAQKKPTAKKQRITTMSSQEMYGIDSGIGSGASQELICLQSSDTVMNFESSPSVMSTSYSQISTMASSTILCSQSSDMTVMSVERDEADSGTASKECDSDIGSIDSDHGLLDLTKEKTKISPLKRPLSSDKQPSQSLDVLCNMCVERTASGIFHHGKSAHLYGCYDCAKKTYRINGNRCPVCNRKSNKPAKLFL
ncbi:E3 ubiquitin-protein ligase Mdm2-like [Phymastichus coffea]|uniref:E3 ubiquitin-protein ligase Mdm2-like n=1 Tax=Phymastichus coffea TaxID=108790 RepID=UPI00273C7ABA|nr:E3 ubiquitin-protein ligase Mdm2-like [Phymastichus coffea]XP_058804902.1 E3 ubiquitin-protein ligase Mdm2-like [Phymastichus coffea]